jgi:hypothetical protein
MLGFYLFACHDEDDPCIAHFDIMSLIAAAAAATTTNTTAVATATTATTTYACIYVELRYACFGIRCGFKPLGVSCGLGKLREFRTPDWSKQTTTDF